MFGEYYTMYKCHGRHCLKITRDRALKSLQVVSSDGLWGMLDKTDQEGHPLYIRMDDIRRGIVKMKLFRIDDNPDTFYTLTDVNNR